MPILLGIVGGFLLSAFVYSFGRMIRSKELYFMSIVLRKSTEGLEEFDPKHLHDYDRHELMEAYKMLYAKNDTILNSILRHMDSRLRQFKL